MDNNEAVEQTGLADGEAVDNDLDFSLDASVDEGGGEEEQMKDASNEGEDVEQTETEYKLDLSELDSDDMPYVDILTEQAKAAGLKADQASKFIVGFTKELHEYHAKLAAEEGQALKKEWGKEFKAKKEQTATFMNKLFSRAKLTDDEKALFANPAMFRVMRKFMGTMGEKVSSVGAGAPQKVMTVQEQINERVAKLVKLKDDPNGNFAEIVKLKAEINNIARVKLY